MLNGKKKEENVFLLSYCLWMTAGILQITMFRYYESISVFCDYLQKVSYLSLLWLFFQRKRNKIRDAVGIGIILLCCILANHSVHNRQIIPVAIFIYFSAEVDFRKILKCTFVLQAVLMVVAVVSSQVGIVEDVIWYQHGRIRHSLGYDYCAYPAHLLLFMSLIWFCIREKIRAAEVVAAILLNYVMYKYTDSRTDFYLAAVSILGFAIWEREYTWEWVNKFRSFTVKNGFTVAAVVSILAQFFYNSENTVMAALNRVLNGRLRLGYNAIQSYGFTLFGQKVRWFGQGSLKTDPTRVYNYVDNSFLKETISFGILFLVILAAGFYFTGKFLNLHREYRMSWAMLMALAYSVVNAHLCVLVFNVFILLLGINFRDKEEEGIIERSIKKVRISLEIDEKQKSILRTGLFVVILSVVTYAQSRGTGYMVSYARMYTWIISGLLCVMAGLCREEGQNRKRIRESCYGKALLFFFVLLCISDFFVNKKFQYAGFAMLFFGGLFCESWSSMKEPDQLIAEFKMAYKIWFLAGICFCIMFRPAIHGVCYSGMYPDAESFGLSMLIAAIVFLSDVQKRQSWLPNGIGALCALYLVWISKKTTIVVAACLLLAAYVVFWMFVWIRAEKKNRIKMIQEIVLILFAGAAVVLVIRKILPVVAPEFGTQIIYENDKQEKIGITLRQLRTIGDWKKLLGGKWYYCKEYLKNMNLLGHDYLLIIKEKKRWAPNSFLMIGYRYGWMAGIVYVMIMAGYIWRAVTYSFEKRDFLLIGIVIGCIGAGMVESVERPFVHMTWLVLYFGLCRISFWMRKGKNG